MPSALCCARQEPDGLGDKRSQPDSPDIHREHHGKQETGNRVDKQDAQYGDLFGDFHILLTLSDRLHCVPAGKCFHDGFYNTAH